MGPAGAPTALEELGRQVTPLARAGFPVSPALNARGALGAATALAVCALVRLSPSTAIMEVHFTWSLFGLVVAAQRIVDMHLPLLGALALAALAANCWAASGWRVTERTRTFLVPFIVIENLVGCAVAVPWLVAGAVALISYAVAQLVRLA